MGQPWPYKLPFAKVFLNDFETPTATKARNEPPNNMRNLKATFLPSNTWVVVGGVRSITFFQHNRKGVNVFQE